MALTSTRLFDSQDLFINVYKPSVFNDTDFNNGKTVNNIVGWQIPDGYLVLKSSFLYHNRLRLTFDVSHKYIRHRAIIKGLIEFNRARTVITSYDLQEGTIEIDIAADERDSLITFLDHIYILVAQELEFKKRLKRVLAFEQKYREDAASVYADLHTTS